MTYKKSLVNKVRKCSVVLLCILCIASSSDTALAKWKDINTSTGYTVSRLKIPYEFKHKKYGIANLFTNLFAKYNKTFVLQSSACYFEDEDTYKIYKTTWDSNLIIEIKVSKLMKYFLSREERDNKIEEMNLKPCGNAIGIHVDTDGLLVLGTGVVTGMDGLEYEPAYNIIQSGDYTGVAIPDSRQHIS